VRRGARALMWSVGFRTKNEEKEGKEKKSRGKK